jgi:hypothetical protein
LKGGQGPAPAQKCPPSILETEKAMQVLKPEEYAGADEVSRALHSLGLTSKQLHQVAIIWHARTAATFVDKVLKMPRAPPPQGPGAAKIWEHLDVAKSNLNTDYSSVGGVRAAGWSCWPIGPPAALNCKPLITCGHKVKKMGVSTLHAPKRAVSHQLAHMPKKLLGHWLKAHSLG